MVLCPCLFAVLAYSLCSFFDFFCLSHPRTWFHYFVLRLHVHPSVVLCISSFPSCRPTISILTTPARGVTSERHFFSFVLLHPSIRRLLQNTTTHTGGRLHRGAGRNYPKHFRSGVAPPQRDLVPPPHFRHQRDERLPQARDALHAAHHQRLLQPHCERDHDPDGLSAVAATRYCYSTWHSFTYLCSP
jgi:hypothetical protein